MTVAAVDQKDGSVRGVKKKKVHFDEKQIAVKKNRGKKQRNKKTTSVDLSDSPNDEVSNIQVENAAKNVPKDDGTAEKSRISKNDKSEKIDPQQTQARKPAVTVTPDIRSRKGSIAVRRSPSNLEPSAALAEFGTLKDEKKPKADPKGRWPFIDFKEQLKIDMFDVSQMATGHTSQRQNIAEKVVDAANLMRPFNADRKNIPTLGFRRRSSLGLYSNHETMDVLSAIQEQQKRRHQERIKSDLTVIQKRVKKALEDVGMESDSDEEECNLKLPPIQVFDTSAERKKMQERNYIMGRIETFEEKALVRKQYLTELMFWFEDHLNMCADVITPDDMKEMVRTTQELHQIISQSLQSFIINGEQVVEKGKMLLAETSKIIEERRAQMAKKTKKERITVYDDKALIADPIKWELAAKTILSVFEDSHKMIKNLMFKNALRLCQKQFEYMMLACDKRLKELDEKKKQCIELQGKLHSAKLQGDKLNRENDEQKRKFTKLSQELMDTKNALEKLQDKNKEMHEKITELNSKTKFLQEELRIKNRTPTPPPTPPPPPEPEKIYVKVVDSSTELRLKEVENELENTKREMEILVSQLNEVTEQFKIEQEKSKTLQERVTELESIEIPEPVPTPHVTPVADTPPPPEVRRPSDLPEKDSSYYKTLMTGMKRDFEIEMEKVKSHVRKERTRGEANIKKIEFQHKDQLSYIQKDTVRMLRAIMHFREHMMVCLEKENLIDQAQALHDLGDIAKDKLSPDPKEVLATIVGTVIDYLNKMEGILSNSFLAMRILMRYQIEKQVEIEVQQRMALKEVQKKDKEVKDTKKNVTSIAKSLKKAKNKLKKAKREADSFSSDKKYLDLLSRYNSMMKMYKNMQIEMEVLQSDFHDTMQRKLEEKETMVISQIKMEMKKKHILAEEQLKMSIADQRQNLQMLCRAYEDNKISKELHLMATSMIQKTMDIPRRKLRNLFEQYITYKTIQNSKARVTRVLNDETAELSIDTRREMEEYVDTMEGKFSHSMKKWRNEMEQLENEKRDLHKRIYKLFNEVLVETGILFVHPLLRDKDKANNMTRAAAQMNRNQLKDILFKKKKRCKEFLTLPDELLGTAVALGQGDSKLWTHRQQQPTTGIEANVVSPHMLVYEINKPKINASRSLRGRGQRYHVGKTESFNISHQNCVQFIRDIPLHHAEMKTFVVH